MLKLSHLILTALIITACSGRIFAQDVLNILIIGAHPDDCEIGAGGLAALYVKKGHRVKFVSMTDGSKGHHVLSTEKLKEIRKKEVEAVKAVSGVSYEILENRDGELEATMENRFEVIRQIRKWNADIVITHRPNTYHPDHRNTGILVLDASFLVRVPRVVPEVPTLNKTPVFLYMSDTFKKPNSFQADFAIDVSDVVDSKVEMMHQHTSQFYEWLPWLNGTLNQIPADEAGKKAWLQNWRVPKFTGATPEIKKALERVYQQNKRVEDVNFIELYELCEYGKQPTGAEVKVLFPFQ